MSPTQKTSTTSRVLMWATLLPSLAAGGAAMLGCSTKPGLAEGKEILGTALPPEACVTPNEGCACAESGKVIDCGHLTETHGSYVTCSVGKRTCGGGGKWGACTSDRITQKSLSGGAFGGLHATNVGAVGGVCPVGFDPCDPLCYQAVDDPTSGFSPPPGFATGPAGLTLFGAAATACTGLTVIPVSSTMTVTDLASPGTMALTVAMTPPSCAATPFATTWAVDKLDQASIAGTNNTNGVLTLGAPLPGTIRVTAFAQAISGFVDIAVKINVKDRIGAAPDVATTLSEQDRFYAVGVPLVGTTASTATWLYPYASTYFPLALPSPVAMYKYAAAPGVSPRSLIKASLRYPAGSTEAASTFNYSILIAESTPDPRVYIPQVAWQRFEQTARGHDASLVLQRFTGGASGVLEQEAAPRTIHFVDGQLKGTVFYNSYNSPQGGNTGAILAIPPGATSPTLAVQPGGSCTGCHSLSADGAKLITNGGVGGSHSVVVNTSKRYDVSGGVAPSPPVLDVFSGNQFTWGGSRTDGSLYMTHGGGADPEFLAPTAPSKLFNPSTPGTAKTVAGWPNDVQAVTPRFSPDGAKLAFGFWGGSALSKAPSGTLSSDTSGKSLVVTDFGCNTGCTGAFAMSNARNVTPGFTEQVGWPSFVPDGSAVIYQRQIVPSTAYINHDPSTINSINGAQADLWISSVPANATTTVIPTKLNALNGLNPPPLVTSYLPTTSRTVSPPPPFHSGNLDIPFSQADNCSNTSTAHSVYDTQLNYLPTSNPTEAGGVNWVLFTSRRMYGNLAYANPWDAESTEPCTSGLIPTKKLWVAAIDKTWTPGSTEPSHPAFYLPGQELAAKNSAAEWVNSPCAPVGTTCNTADDCCAGTGPIPTTTCKITTAPSTKTCQNITGACVASGGVCNMAGAPGDCCTGLTCPAVGGTCFNASATVFSSQTLQREYVASCPAGSRAKWRFVEWQASIPAMTSIDFAVQTKDMAVDTYAPAVPRSAGSITTTTAVGVWAHGANTVDEVLSVPPGPGSLSYLLLLITFNPNATGTLAPTLGAWRQTYDCIPTQ